MCGIVGGAVACALFGLIVQAAAQQTALKDTTSMTIKGALNYQACDDKVCFTPQTVPLRWTVSLRQLDRERVKP